MISLGSFQISLNESLRVNLLLVFLDLNGVNLQLLLQLANVVDLLLNPGFQSLDPVVKRALAIVDLTCAFAC